MANNQLTKYLIPTSDDVPSVRVAFLEHPYPHGAAARRGRASCRSTGRRCDLNRGWRAHGSGSQAIPCPERLMELMDVRADVGRSMLRPYVNTCQVLSVSFILTAHR